MPSWTHLIRFVAVEDDRTYLGQLVDPTRDIGKDSVDGTPAYAYKIEGSMFDGKVTDKQFQVKKVSEDERLGCQEALLNHIR
jgi:hypothetical protein